MPFKKILPSEYFCIFSLVVITVFVSWLMMESTDKKIHDAYKLHEKLLKSGQTTEAYLLFIEKLKEEGDGPLDPIWLPFVRIQGNGYDRLPYYLRVLEAAPNRLATYEELSKLLMNAPESFNNEVKPRYLRDVNSVVGINKEHLKSSGLYLQE